MHMNSLARAQSQKRRSRYNRNLFFEERFRSIDHASERGVSIELDKNPPRARERRHCDHFRIVLSWFRDRCDLIILSRSITKPRKYENTKKSRTGTLPRRRMIELRVCCEAVRIFGATVPAADAVGFVDPTGLGGDRQVDAFMLLQRQGVPWSEHAIGIGGLGSVQPPPKQAAAW